ncbi:unnamed protein product [Ilex paraguariensis]|uniref:Peptidase A1 domain-containing protein n=1 Tax=Ilex paraguariensis TaxID=185542 RepID=A0ABC8RCU0_9AQUA
MLQSDIAKIMSLFSLTLVSTLFLVGSVGGKPNGLTLWLIHRDSPDSPFFQSSLTCKKEKTGKFVSQSNHRASYLSNVSSNSVHPQIVRPQVDIQSFSYIVKVGIGTFKATPTYKEYYLEMDTGSTLSWMQCEGCTRCFKQTPGPFPKNSSKSFRPILCEDGLCRPKICDGKYCSYSVRYLDGSYTYGILAKETFCFNSNTSKIEKVESLIFGCGKKNNIRFLDQNTNKVAGIIGLGWGQFSFVTQIHSVSDGRFSYCFPVINQYTRRPRQRIPMTYLRFGADIPQKRGLSSTTLKRIENQSQYHLDLRGISLNRRKLNIDAAVFALRRTGHRGGCIIDNSGTIYTRIIKPAYVILRRELEKHFSRFSNLRRFRGNSQLGVNFCYERQKPEGFENLPSITFHFKGLNADLVVQSEGCFEVVDKYHSPNNREYFCLAMAPSDVNSVIGAHQQTNQRFIYDMKNNRLFFHPEVCSKNA